MKLQTPNDAISSHPGGKSLTQSRPAQLNPALMMMCAQQIYHTALLENTCAF